MVTARAFAKPDSCRWIGKLKDAEEHLGGCGYAITLCPHEGCKARVERRRLHDHEQGCLFRKVPCPQCESEEWFQQQHLTALLATCPKRPVPCPAGCLNDESKTVTQVPHDQLSQHQAICPMEIIDCAFASAGCKVRLARYCMAAHEQDAGQHIGGLLQALQDNQQELRSTRNQLQSMESALALTKSELQATLHEHHEQALEMFLNSAKLVKMMHGQAKADLNAAKATIQELMTSQQKLQSLTTPQLQWKVNLQKQGAGRSGKLKSACLYAQGYHFTFMIYTRKFGEPHLGCTVKHGSFPVDVTWTTELMSHGKRRPSKIETMEHTFTRSQWAGFSLGTESELSSADFTQDGFITLRLTINAISAVY